MRRSTGLFLDLICLLALAGAAGADDIPITGTKLVIVDTMAAKGKAKTVFLAKDAEVAKGTGIDPALISASLEIAYDAASGAFVMPQGISWTTNSATQAKYLNKTAPAGGAVKLSLIKPASLVSVKASSLGDAPLTISAPPSGAVYVAYTAVNGGETTRLCTLFTGCAHKAIAGGTGFKLVCKTGADDPSCMAAPLPTTTTTTTTTSTTTTTTTTIPPCEATTGGYCWFAGAPGANCTATCAAAGRVYDPATDTYGAAGCGTNCPAIITALGIDANTTDLLCYGCVSTTGCSVETFGDPPPWLATDCTGAATADAADTINGTVLRACACQ